MIMEETITESAKVEVAEVDNEKKNQHEPVVEALEMPIQDDVIEEKDKTMEETITESTEVEVAEVDNEKKNQHEPVVEALEMPSQDDASDIIEEKDMTME